MKKSEKQSNKKEWLTAYEVQQEFTLSKNTLRALVNRGVIGCSKLGGKRYFLRNEIVESLRKNYIREDGKVDF